MSLRSCLVVRSLVDARGPGPVDPEAFLGALLGMELRREDVVLADPGAILQALVARDGEGRFRVLGRHVVAVHEVHVLARGDSLEGGAPPGAGAGGGRLDPVPAYLRD